MKTEDLDHELLEEQSLHPQMSVIEAGEIILGVLSGLNDQGQPLVDFFIKESKQSVKAITTVAVNQQHIGRQVALLFAEGDPEHPVIIGVIHSPLNEMIENIEMAKVEHPQPTQNQSKDQQNTSTQLKDVLLDGKSLVLEGKEEVVLKCGESSITLTKAGKILIRGKYLLNRSSGVNRIMGGSVQVN